MQPAKLLPGGSNQRDDGIVFPLEQGTVVSVDVVARGDIARYGKCPNDQPPRPSVAVTGRGGVAGALVGLVGLHRAHLVLVDLPLGTVLCRVAPVGHFEWEGWSPGALAGGSPLRRGPLNACRARTASARRAAAPRPCAAMRRRRRICRQPRPLDSRDDVRHAVDNQTPAMLLFCV